MRTEPVRKADVAPLPVEVVLALALIGYAAATGWPAAMLANVATQPAPQGPQEVCR